MGDYTYLMHHGIKGQKWGERNGPPYPIEDKVMKKGTKLGTVVLAVQKDGKEYTISGAGRKVKDANNNDKEVPLYTYNMNDKWDQKVYKGPFSNYLIQRRGPQYEPYGYKTVGVTEIRYKTLKDLMMPNRAQRFQEFKNLYNSDKKELVKDLDSTKKQLVARNYNPTYKNFTNKDLKKINFNKLNTDDDFEKAYEIFNHAMEGMFYNKSTSKYYDSLSKKYDAMVDDNNVNRYNKAHDPVIIFNMNKVLKEIGSTAIYNDEVIDNINEVSKELSKYGLNVRY